MFIHLKPPVQIECLPTHQRILLIDLKKIKLNKPSVNNFEIQRKY